ncbi:LysM peptidoglycan-binding domain-containing protein [Phytomonospora sp. NPDC050363]|uniref:LysM peptidoglycan-binding domain-containing protein n=1 Tax=Phytomonospora sp. NPDC050363 TaxID=3155642 RepID=UPI0033D46780
MHPTPHRPRSGRRLLLGSASLLATLALVGGLPLLLIRFANPIALLGDRTDWSSLLTSRDNGELLMAALAVVAWIAWATFAFSVLVETIALARDRPTMRLPALSAQQRLAAALVAGIALLITAPTASAAPAAAAPAIAPPAITATVASDTAHPTVAAAADGERTYTVEADDHLFGIAERYLGDGDYYGELADLNDLDNPRALNPGDTITLPDGAKDRGERAGARGDDHPAEATTPPAAGQGLTYTIAPGDRLADIAERFTGDPDNYTRLAELNDIDDPNLIRPGDTITLPGRAHDRGEQRHATGTLHAPSTPDAETPPADGEAPTPDGEIPPPPPEVSQPPPPPSTPPATPSTPTPAETTTGTNATQAPAVENEQTEEDGDFQLFPVAASLAAAGIAAAGILAFIGRARRRHANHRRESEPTPAPLSPTVEVTELELAVAAQPAHVDRVDAALHAVAAAYAATPASVAAPDIAAVWVTDGAVHLLLANPCPEPPPAPFVLAGDNWLLPAEAELPADTSGTALLPTLVTVASNDNSHLLIDLERLGVVTVNGTAQGTGDLLRHIATDLLCSPWSSDVDLTLTGFSEHDTTCLNHLATNSRLHITDNLAGAVVAMQRRASTALEHLADGDTLTERLRDGDSWPAHVLLIGPELADEPDLATIVTDLAGTGRCAVALVTSSPTDSPWQMTVNADGNLLAEFLGLLNPKKTMPAAALPTQQLADIAALVEEAIDSTHTIQADKAVGTPTDASGDLGRDWNWEDVTVDHIATAPSISDLGPSSVYLHPTPPAQATKDDPPEPSAPEPAANSTLTETEPAVEAAGNIADTEPEPAKAPTEGGAPDRYVFTRGDRTLDADLEAWNAETADRPRLSILGPATLTANGPLPETRIHFITELVAFLYSRGPRGVTVDQLHDSLWPETGTRDDNRRAIVNKARRWLGDIPDGTRWLPELGIDRCFKLAQGILCDWDLFTRLRARAATGHHPEALADLRAAIDLVRDVPLRPPSSYRNSKRDPYAWTTASPTIAPHRITAAIVDAAHDYVELLLETGDLEAARWALTQAWIADPARDHSITWRDAMRVAAAADNRGELRGLVEQMMEIRAVDVPEELDEETFRLLCELAPDDMGVRA